MIVGYFNLTKHTKSEGLVSGKTCGVLFFLLALKPGMHSMAPESRTGSVLL